MPAAEDQIVAVRRPSGRAQGETGQQGGAGGALADRQSAAAPSALSRWRSRASHRGGPGRQAGRHRRVPRVQVGRWGAHHAGVAGRHSAALGGHAGTAIAQAAGLATGARAGR
jgi:hypothetical protein